MDNDRLRNALIQQINMRTMDPSLPPELRGPIGGHLIDFYLQLALSKGTATTPEDAHEAWQQWLESQGGRLDKPDGTINFIDPLVAAGIVAAVQEVEEIPTCV